MARKRKRGEAPTCNCLLLCEDVLTSASGKHFLQGIIGRISVPEFPSRIGGFVAYVRVSNVYRGEKVTLTFSDAASEQVCIAADLDFPREVDPFGVYTLISQMPMFQVDAPGRYVFSANHDGVPFVQLPVELSLLETR